jgi:hypothetical protein
MKPAYKLRVSDFIPAGLGMVKYITRNDCSFLDEIEKERVMARGGLLAVYNMGIFLGTSAFVIYGVYKGLESILK